jgi:hypothetical protein
VNKDILISIILYYFSKNNGYDRNIIVSGFAGAGAGRAVHWEVQEGAPTIRRRLGGGSESPGGA